MSKFNFFEEVEVSSTAFEDCVISFGFLTTSFMLAVMSDDPDDEVYYNFGDLVTVHGNLTPLQNNEALSFDHRRESKISFARKNPGDTVIVRVEAWA